MTAAIQTLWCELAVATLADAGVASCVVSPGSRSTPLVAALAADGRFDLPTIIDERAAAFFALGVARATGRPAAIVCTSGTAAAHYFPAIVEASAAGLPLIAITADRPPELHDCGANQTIDQVKMYGGFVRGAFDLGAPVGSPQALRAVRRKVAQAVALACGPRPGPVQLEVPLRKPLEPAAPATEEERVLARAVAALRRTPVVAAPPRLVADPDALAELSRAIAAEPRGVIVAGAMACREDAIFALAARTGYPVLAETASQLRLGPRPPGIDVIDHFDLVLAAGELAPAPRLVIQIGAEPVAAGWPGAFADAECWVLAEHAWHDADSTARGVIVGELAASLAALVAASPPRRDVAFATAWAEAEQRAAAALDHAIAAHARSEVAAMRAALDAMPEGSVVQLGNSLPIRIADHVPATRLARRVISQRGVSGIDGSIASAAGATRGGAPVLLVLGDVSFAHDLGGLLAAREASAPLAIVVIDNAGGQIFGGLPIARAGLGAAFDRHFTTEPGVDPAAVAHALGARAVTAASPAAVAAAVADALAARATTVIHAPVSSSGARDVRTDALALLVPARATVGASHA